MSTQHKEPTQLIIDKILEYNEESNPDGSQGLILISGKKQDDTAEIAELVNGSDELPSNYREITNLDVMDTLDMLYSTNAIDYNHESNNAMIYDISGLESNVLEDVDLQQF